MMPGCVSIPALLRQAQRLVSRAFLCPWPAADCVVMLVAKLTVAAQLRHCGQCTIDGTITAGRDTARAWAMEAQGMRYGLGALSQRASDWAGSADACDTLAESSLPGTVQRQRRVISTCAITPVGPLLAAGS
jgi:hypothetical protein